MSGRLFTIGSLLLLALAACGKSLVGVTATATVDGSAPVTDASIGDAALFAFDAATPKDGSSGVDGSTTMVGPDGAVITTCNSSLDCAALSQACRQNVCQTVTCSTGELGATCTASEQCVAGSCVALKGGSATTMAAGGTVSTSSQHIHIGLTGQGQAIGSSASTQHQQTTGGTAVMAR